MWLVKVKLQGRMRYLLTDNWAFAGVIADVLREFGYEPDGPEFVLSNYDAINARKFTCVDGKQLWLCERSWGYEGKEVTDDGS